MMPESSKQIGIKSQRGVTSKTTQVSENEPPDGRGKRSSILNDVTRHLLCYKGMISERMQELAPKSIDDEWSDAFVDEINANVRVTYLLDGLLFGSTDECMEFYEFYKEEVDEIVREIEAGESRNYRKTRTK